MLYSHLGAKQSTHRGGQADETHVNRTASMLET